MHAWFKSLFVIMLAILVHSGAAAQQQPTAQQIEELKQSVCVFYRHGKYLRTAKPLGIAGPDRMVRVDYDGEELGWKASVPYKVICDRIRLTKRPEHCQVGTGCFEEQPRRAKDCKGMVVEIRPPLGSSIRFTSECWHLAKSR